MSGFFIVAILVAAACYFGWSALAALRSGDATLYVRGGRQRYFSRRANAAAYWLIVSWYVALAAVCIAGSSFALYGREVLGRCFRQRRHAHVSRAMM
jgi:hypothetical protein